MIDTLPPLTQTLKEAGLRADKKFGQNFLLDLNVTEKIVRLYEQNNGTLKDRHCLEIGPGPGGLTRAILKQSPKSFLAIEKDDRFLPLLSDVSKNAPDTDITIHHGDALDHDLISYAQTLDATKTPDAKISILANLPYNVGTLLLLNWLNQMEHIDGMALMFQKEVAMRIVADTRTKNYGRLSVISQYLCDTKWLMKLPASAFTPPPKVESCVVYFKAKKDYETRKIILPYLERITKSAFGQRRKMLRQSLKSVWKDPSAALNACGIKETVRAEELSVDDFVMLATYLKSE